MIDIFEGSARDKFYDILFNANAVLVKNEIDKIFEKFVAMSELCESMALVRTRSEIL